MPLNEVNIKNIKISNNDNKQNVKLRQFSSLNINYRSFIHFWHASLGVHAPNVDISLQSGQFRATSVASFRERLSDFRSCWLIVIHKTITSTILID